MSGALTERVFVTKLDKVGFVDVVIVDRDPVPMEEAIDNPLFTPDLIDLMRTLLTPDQQEHLATSITVQARKPD